MAEQSPSQIPVSVNRRTSLTPSVLQQSTNAVNANANVARAQSPAPSAKSSTPKNAEPRRQSLVAGPGGRRPSLSENAIDDPVHLRAQIALLKSSLQASQQRVLELSTSLNLGTATAFSSTAIAAGVPASPGPWTPVNGSSGLPDVDALTLGSELFGRPSPLMEDVEGEKVDSAAPPLLQATGGQETGRLPHSIPSYDLRSRAVTPGKTPLVDRVADERLGLSRIPLSTVTHAISLHPTSPALSSSGIPRPSSRTHLESPPTGRPPEGTLQSPSLGPNSPGSPYISTNGSGLGCGRPSMDGRLSPSVTSSLRRSTGPGSSAASTKVIDALQTELLNLRTHLDRVKQEARSHQRVIGQLTRQTEDLKETRERMRVECESQNNVIARKERLLQEVLERARTAEASLAQHISTRKASEQSTKKSIQHMTAQLVEAQTAQTKAERECNSLRDGVRSLREAWAREVKSVREEFKKGEERGLREREEARMKHIALVKLVQSQTADRQAIQQLASNAIKQSTSANTAFEAQTASLRAELEKSSADSLAAKATAQELASELVRLRRMMREPSRTDIHSIAHGGQSEASTHSSLVA